MGCEWDRAVKATGSTEKEKERERGQRDTRREQGDKESERK